MAYHAHLAVSLQAAVLNSARYVPLCFGIKSLIMTIDDILDHDVDGLVERTKYRPIPRGAISITRAWLFFALQVLVDVTSALKFLSPKALQISMLVWPLYIIYPTCKRWTNLAPIPLGLMFNVGALMGWCDVLRKDPPLSTVLMYIGACMWTLTYETVYQHQDKADDIRIGLNSPALLLGNYTTISCAITASGFFICMAYGGWLNQHGVPLYIALTISAFRLFSRLFTTNLDEPDSCRKFFLDSPAIGGIILIGFVVDAISWRLMHGIRL